MEDLMKKKLPVKEVFALGFFMFALFLGAGNLIFPPLLGQQAGEAIWPSVGGFLVTGVGLPLLAIITISHVEGDLDVLANRVHRIFALIFPVVIYLTIGPFFGIPRTGTVAYEVGIVPFLPSANAFTLFLTTLVFFGVTFWLALNPAKLVDRVGKVLTPILFVAIVVLAIRGFTSPLGEVGRATGPYIDGAYFTGFLEGFLTMDAIGALVFGIVIINRIQEKGVRNIQDVKSYTIKAGIIAGIGLSFVYVTLAYLGATSVDVIGEMENGGAVLIAVTASLFGPFGTILLAIIMAGACLTTSVGLVSACGEFLSSRLKNVSYPVIIAVLSLFSMTMANLGLAQLISFSLPILIAMYPVTIVLIALSLIHSALPLSRPVYCGAIIGAMVVGIYDGLTMAGLNMGISHIVDYLPLHAEGVGWIVPSIVGGLLGYLYDVLK